MIGSDDPSTSDGSGDTPPPTDGVAFQAVSTVNIPGRLEAENYNTGGENVGYKDTTPGNSGGAYRTDDVDIEATTDTGGGYNVGWIVAGEWLAFNVQVPFTGTYNVSARMASAYTTAASLHFEVDGVTASGAGATLTGGDGWQSWHTVSGGQLSLTAGAHVIKVVFDSSKLNLNYVDIAGGPKGIIFGMFNNTNIPPGSEVSSPANYRTIANKWFVGSKMKLDRVFNSGLPTSYSSCTGGQDPTYGNLSFQSVKPPGGDYKGVAAGTYDSQIRSLAASIPAGVFFTMYHEPEDNMSASDFVAMFRRFYSVAKAANPGLHIGYVAMAYQWRPGSTTTVNEDAWYPGADATDYLGVDAYDEGWMGQHSLDTQSDFQRWYTWAKGKNKPIVIAEYGVEDASTGGFSDSVRATIIHGTMQWIATQPQIRVLSYWNGTASTPGGKNHFLNPTTSAPTDNYSQARAAFNAGVNLYGTSSTTFP